MKTRFAKKFEEIKSRVKKIKSWKIASYAGQHDEAGARICNDKDQTVATTHRVRKFRDSKSWKEYQATAAFIANAPDDIRNLIKELNRLYKLVEKP